MFVAKILNPTLSMNIFLNYPYESLLSQQSDWRQNRKSAVIKINDERNGAIAWTQYFLSTMKTDAYTGNKTILLVFNSSSIDIPSAS